MRTAEKVENNFIFALEDYRVIKTLNNLFVKSAQTNFQAAVKFQFVSCFFSAFPV